MAPPTLGKKEMNGVKKRVHDKHTSLHSNTITKGLAAIKESRRKQVGNALANDLFEFFTTANKIGDGKDSEDQGVQGENVSMEGAEGTDGTGYTVKQLEGEGRLTAGDMEGVEKGKDGGFEGDTADVEMLDAN